MNYKVVFLFKFTKCSKIFSYFSSSITYQRISLIQQINNIKQGVTDIDNVPTKHYLKEELELLLTLEGFEVSHINKINYGWDTEFHKPPKWLAEPYPWDWMCIAKKKS